MKTKKVPLRMCTGCGEMFDKRTLVRVVKSPEGEVSLDLTGKKAGRGAYVCKNADCLKKARKKRAFERAFSIQIDDSVYDKMEEEIKNADIVVTGEGRLDHQTAMGKAPVGVAKLGKKYGAKTVAFAGSVTKEAVACNEAGIDAFFPILRGISTLEEAMDPATAKANMTAATEQVFRLL